MEILFAVLGVGVLLVLVRRLVLRRDRAPAPEAPVSPVVSRASDESAREAGALVDGLIIGHHLTRTHYEDRLEEQEETIEDLRAGATGWYPHGEADEDTDEDAELDDLGWAGAPVDDLEMSGEAEDAWGDALEDAAFGYDEDEDEDD